MASENQIGVSKPTKWPEEDHQNANMEQVRAPHQLTLVAAAGWSPSSRCLLLAIERNRLAEQQHGEAQVGIPAEHDMIDGVAHGVLSGPGSIGWR